MPIEINMPALSPTMETGTLAKWLVKEGDEIAAGDIIAEIETDKATMEVEAADEGRLGRILVDAGSEDIPVGTPIALLLEEGEDESALAGAGKAAKASKAAPEPKPEEKSEKKPEKKSEKKSEPKPAPKPEVKSETAPASRGERIFASPLARRMAEKSGIDLAGIGGSGPHGRIVKADVEAAAKSGTKKSAAAAPAGEFTPPADVPYEEVKLSGMRKVIARRMTESKTQVPHFYLTIDIGLDRLLALRAELNAGLEQRGVKLSVNDFIIRASALALADVPAANAMFAGDKAWRFTRQDISVAVAVEGGLMTPVIRDAGAKGLAAISSEMKALAEKAREGKLVPEDYQGGTFSISNLGMHGIREFAAVINPPQGAILAVGAGGKRAVVEDGAVVVRTVMTVTLAVDHRVLDGAIGAEFLAAFKGYMEKPMTMLL